MEEQPYLFFLNNGSLPVKLGRNKPYKRALGLAKNPTMIVTVQEPSRIKSRRSLEASCIYSGNNNSTRKHQPLATKQHHIFKLVFRLNKKKNWASKSCDEDRTLHVVMSNRSNVL